MGAPEIVDTSRLGPQQGFRIWARILARDLEPLAVRRDAERPFSVFMQRQAVGPIHLQRIRAEAHVAERTRATIRAADPGLFHLMLQLRGSCAVEQDDRSAVAGPGQLVAWQSSTPYAIQGLEPFEALIVVCPARLLAKEIGRWTAEPLESTAGVGRIARNYLTDLFDTGEGDVVGERAHSLLARSTVELIQALYVEEDDRGTRCGRGTEDLRREISSYIDANLSDPELDVASIADAIPVSRGYLHRLLAAEGTTVARHHPRPAAGALPARPPGPGVRGRVHRPDRDALGVRQRGPLQPGVPHGVRRVAERTACRGRRRDGPGVVITTAVRASRWRRSACPCPRS